MRQQIYPTTIRFRAPEDIAAELAAVASQDHETMSSYIRRLIISDIARRKAASQSRSTDRMPMHTGPTGALALA